MSTTSKKISLERAERAEIVTEARKYTQKQGMYKFKLYFSRKCQVLRSTRISNTFLYNSQPRDVLKAWAACGNTSVPAMFKRLQTNISSVFQSNQSTAPIDISCLANNQGQSANNSPVTPKSLFSAASIERDWVHFWLHFQFNFVSGRFEEKSPAQRKCRRVNESESDEECYCLEWSLTFRKRV